MVNAIIISQARVGSSRLPGKILMKIDGETLLSIHLKRLKKSRLSQKIILATTFENGVEEIMKVGKENKVEIFQGDTENVLERFYKASCNYSPEYIVRVTSDCPLIDYRIIDKLIKVAFEKKLDYVSNILEETFPDGQDVEVFTFETLEKSYKKAKLKSDKEHVTTFMRRNSNFCGGNIFSSKNIKSSINYSNVRMTVDEIEDFKAIQFLIKKFGYSFKWEIYADYITSNPSLFKNQKITRNEGYLNSLKQESNN
jgi:spore coat polysaccharide biosynthesis protein SpsF (cytidylyltransferase family)